ncbi:MAG: ferritin-like domain-containing protein [Candidatus Binatia bacterium]
MPRQDEPIDPHDPRVIRTLSYYRDAEVRGAALLLRLTLRLDDPTAQLNLARHLADETRHAALITERIVDLGAAPEIVSDGYQARMAQAGAVPRGIVDFYAITLVAEERARQRYVAHAKAAAVDTETRRLLRTLLKDETWHLAWVGQRLRELAAVEGADRVAHAVRRFRAADATVVAALDRSEREAFGFSLFVPSERQPSMERSW